MIFNFGSKTRNFANIIRSANPDSFAILRGSEKYKDLRGRIDFYDVSGGTLIVTEISGLPRDGIICPDAIFGFHIHEGEKCTGTKDDPFSDVKGHFNPENCPHPAHAGDMPVLFGNNGYAWSAFFTNRIKAKDVIGHTVIIHSEPDDYRSQPSGKSGEKIACGEIKGR